MRMATAFMTRVDTLTDVNGDGDYHGDFYG